MASEGREFDRLLTVIQRQQQLINSIATKLEKLESIGGGGSASIEDYKEGTTYKRNVLVVDTNTETVYRVLEEYTSVTVEDDCSNGYLKLVSSPRLLHSIMNLRRKRLMHYQMILLLQFIPLPRNTLLRNRSNTIFCRK